VRARSLSPETRDNDALELDMFRTLALISAGEGELHAQESACHGKRHD